MSALFSSKKHLTSPLHFMISTQQLFGKWPAHPWCVLKDDNHINLSCFTPSFIFFSDVHLSLPSAAHPLLLNLSLCPLWLPPLQGGGQVSHPCHRSSPHCTCIPFQRFVNLFTCTYLHILPLWNFAKSWPPGACLSWTSTTTQSERSAMVNVLP